MHVSGAEHEVELGRCLREGIYGLRVSHQGFDQLLDQRRGEGGHEIASEVGRRKPVNLLTRTYLVLPARADGLAWGNGADVGPAGRVVLATGGRAERACRVARTRGAGRGWGW